MHHTIKGNMLTRRQAMTLGAGVFGVTAATLAGCGKGASEEKAAAGAKSASDLLASMSLEQKVAQLIMPAIRTWGDDYDALTDFSAVPELGEALRRHQYGGVILFGSNVVDTEQTARLVSDLQTNNAQGQDAKSTGAIPYLVAADQEGGSVARLTMGTRGTGSMAIGATGEDAHTNARDTGTIFGIELSALGINVNLAPCADVIGDLADPGMSTRVFSDDQKVVCDLAQAFSEGVAKNNVITCFKHFPGTGDGSDDPTSEHITLDELREQGLACFTTLIENGASMLMTSAVTFPAFDDEQVLADGKTKGFYPATMSHKIVGDLLRGELGFDGVVITDALEMEQFVTEPDTGAQLLPGEPHGVEQGVLIAEQCLKAGCDILLIPNDINSTEAVQWYDDYLAGIVAKVEDGSIEETRIDESVRRILELKESYGILDIDVSGDGLDEAIAEAQEKVGTSFHHDIERGIAEAAVTLLKGEDVVPVPGHDARIVILGRTAVAAIPIGYALGELMEAGAVDADAHVDNRITGESSGSEDAAMHIYIDHYYDLEEDKLLWSDDTSAAIAKADYVICMSATWAGIEKLQDDDATMQAVARALEEAHAAGAKFVIVSNNIPVEGARFPEADAVVCSYLSSGYVIDPSAGSDAEHMGAINANAPAALRAVFGMGDMPGTLPINVYALERDADGQWAYTDEVLFARGTGATA